MFYSGCSAVTQSTAIRSHDVDLSFLTSSTIPSSIYKFKYKNHAKPFQASKYLDAAAAAAAAAVVVVCGNDLSVY